MRKKKKVKVIYIIGILWLLTTFGFPLFSILRVLIMVGISVAVFGFAMSKWADSSKKNNQQNQQMNGTATNPGTAEKINAEVMANNDAKRNAAMSANPYSSTYRYSSNGNVNVSNNGNNAQPQVQLSARERRKLAKQAAMEAELARARAAEAAKDEATKLQNEAKKREAEAQKQAEQSLAEKYNVPKRPRTSDSAINKMLDDEENAIAEMRRLDDAIEDEKVSSQIVHLEEVTTKIVNYVIEHPNKKNQVRRFFNYYLPTSLKLLQAYDHADEAGISGENIDGTMEQVEQMMDKALEAFDKQLDALYADEKMDVTSEIKVMENLLNQEGLTDDIMLSQEK